MMKSLFIVIQIFLSFPAAAQSPSDFANQSPHRSGNYGNSYGDQSGGSYNPTPRTPSDYADQHPTEVVIMAILMVMLIVT